ncbi:putative sugar epimerase YhfK [Hartmannibacter diazotrophicus]|uniref:Putative sugar epimerase YhfK n=1 Tax=Hartmannibacter diazotrophicus TaxID=1482074 RepID=A0A2C9DBR4_9HYPH|nr:NAD(P)-binding oxidoreductase [Hartmannibacter diazotrophicus]SON57161.1 putative sugar epimerase YhfK [Hartmannibacter diazotrophicus]
MNVIAFGATGSVGRLAVEKMLADGHAVTAFVRDPAKLRIVHPNLQVVVGNALDPEAVADAVDGHDAVVVTLGAGTSRKSTIRSKGTMTIIQAMQARGVRRLICQSTLGAHESWPNLNFFWKRIMFGLLLRPVFKDHELQESLVRASGLDWTIVRPSAFTDGPATGTYREGFPPAERRLTLTIARSDIAAFLSRQLADRRYLRRAVAISN